MLQIPELHTALTFAEEVMNDVRLVACRSTFGYSEVGETTASAAALDLVDGLLLGTLGRIALVRGDRDRDDYYDALHKNHDRLGGQGFSTTTRKACPPLKDGRTNEQPRSNHRLHSSRA